MRTTAGLAYLHCPSLSVCAPAMEGRPVQARVPRLCPELLGQAPATQDPELESENNFTGFY